MEQWLKLHTSILDSVKLQLLPAEMFKAVINLWALAKRCNGLPPVAEIAWQLRMSEDAARETLEALAKRGLLESKDGTYRPRNWEKHQGSGNASTERSQRYRARSRNSGERKAKALHATQYATQDATPMQRPCNAAGDAGATETGRETRREETRQDETRVEDSPVQDADAAVPELERAADEPVEGNPLGRALVNLESDVWAIWPKQAGVECGMAELTQHLGQCARPLEAMLGISRGYQVWRARALGVLTDEERQFWPAWDTWVKRRMWRDAPPAPKQPKRRGPGVSDSAEGEADMEAWVEAVMAKRAAQDAGWAREVA